MNRLSFIFIILSFFSTFSEAKVSPLVKLCEATGGELFSGFIPCPLNDLLVNDKFCIFSEKPLIYTNGCSTEGFGLGYSDAFFPACVGHDLCYHNEPQTTGISRKNCDLNFYSYMLKICKDQKEDSKKCRAAAWSYFRVVRLGGKKGYDCANEDYDYTEILKIQSSKEYKNMVIEP